MTTSTRPRKPQTPSQIEAALEAVRIAKRELREAEAAYQAALARHDTAILEAKVVRATNAELMEASGLSVPGLRKATVRAKARAEAEEGR